MRTPTRDASADRADALDPPPPSPPPSPTTTRPNTPPRALALTPSAVKTIARPAANASVGATVFPSSESFVAVDMYDTVIGSRPREQGLNDVQRPAAYSIPRDLAD